MKNLFTHAGRGLALATLLAAGLASQTQAQGVRIGTAGTPDASAVLDLVSGTKGALLPRVAALADVASPATGLIVYQTGGTPGYYYYTGTAWQQLATATGTVSTASNGLTKTGQNVALGGALTSATVISQAGNNLGITGGNVGIGTAAPQSTLDVSGDFRVSTGSVNATLGTTGPGNANISGYIGQSFTLPVAASLTSIRLVDGANNFSTTIQIFSGSGPNGTAQLATPLPISFVANTSTTVVLPTPLSLPAGTYTLMLNTNANGNVNPIRYFNNGENYTGGTVYSNTSAFVPVDLDFTVAYTSGSPTSAFNVGTSGNVGIGTSAAPSQKLEVVGGSVKISTAGQGLIFADGSTQTTAAAPATGSGSYIQNTTSPQAGSNFNVSGSGNVGTSLGVGTSGAPVATLDVRGSQALAYVTTGSTSGTFTLTAAHHTVRRFGPCNNISIPDASTCAGRIYVIISSNGAGSNVGLSVQSGGPIYDDVANSVITFIGSGERLSIQSDGTGWIVIGR
jgi:hypothetical protein